MGYPNAYFWNEGAKAYGLEELTFQERNLYYNTDGTPRGEKGQAFHDKKYGGAEIHPGVKGTKGYAFPMKSTSGSADYSGYLSSWGASLPEAPELIPYEGYSNQYGLAVDLTPGEKEAQARATGLLSGKEGSFRQSLSGVPDYAQLNRMIGMNQMDFENKTLPQMADQLGGTPYGNSGLSKQMKSEAIYQQSRTAADMRYQAYQSAKQEALAAAQILPGLAGVAGLSRNNEINNILRDVQVHFQNQGLAVQEAQLQSQEFANAMAMAQFAFSADMQTQQLELQRQQLAFQQEQSSGGGLGSLLGSLGGAAIGYYTGGFAGAAAGYNLGGGLGSAFSGDYQGANAGAGAGINSLLTASMYNSANPDSGLFKSMWGGKESTKDPRILAPIDNSWTRYPNAW